MAAPVTAGQAFQPGTPVPLFDVRCQPGSINAYSYDVSPDGRRFLVIAPREDSRMAPSLTVVLNWAAGLKK